MGSDGFEKVLIGTRGAMDRRCVLRPRFQIYLFICLLKS
jgi:hypothetical protein